MSICRTCSEVSRAARAVRGIRRILLAVAALLSASATAATAQAVLTQAEALALAFPTATSVERRTGFLSEGELARVRQLAGSRVEVRPGVLIHYVAKRGDQPLGVAYFDAHRVRTLSEVLMIVVSPRATVERIEILRFSEPPEYRAPGGWLAQFEGEPLSDQLSVRRGIANITGASLTSRAVTESVRRVLALHTVLDPLATRRPASRP
jgi:electron transport complex protein RnfG